MRYWHFLITTIFKSLYFLKWCPIFDTSQLIQFSKFNNFLGVCWFLAKNHSNFVPPVWKLHYPYCHIPHNSLAGPISWTIKANQEFGLDWLDPTPYRKNRFSKGKKNVNCSKLVTWWSRLLIQWTLVIVNSVLSSIFLLMRGVHYSACSLCYKKSPSFTKNVH